MAKLADLITPQKEIHTIMVHALTLSDLAQLIAGNKDAFLALFSGGNFMDVALQFPKMVSDVIALSTKDNTEDAMKLPVGTQIDLLMGIWAISQIDVESLGKMIAGILKGLEKTTKNLPHLTNGNTP